MSGKTPAIIPRTDQREHTSAWQTELAQAVSSCDELLQLLDIDPQQLNIRPLASSFPLRVPHSMIRRMRPGDPHDPLLLQVLPVHAESVSTPGYDRDPLQEAGFMPVAGLLHKYHGRALLTVTGACAVHCRYCFRRHHTYLDANPANTAWTQVIEYLAAHTELGELILSGGDPLSLTDSRLHRLTDQLGDIPHLHTLRIHTRMPVVLPARIDAGLLDWLAGLQLRIVMVVHCNHANEIDADVERVMQALSQAGVTLLNQSVLLHGINDDCDTLVRLSQRLFAAGILPYYLHQLDRVQGAAHFEVDDRHARQLHQEMRERLAGYLVPRLVRELPGARSKLPL